MINNKQVNIWRGDQEPPTLFHVWVYRDERMLLYNGTEWVTFVDDKGIIDKINKLQEDVNLVKQEIDVLSKATVNNKLIKDSPVLNGEDLTLNKNGNFVNSTKSISDNIIQLDTMFVTQIIG